MDGFGRPDHPGKAEIFSFRMAVVPLPTVHDISFYGKIEMMVISGVASLVSRISAEDGGFSCFCIHFLGRRQWAFFSRCWWDPMCIGFDPLIHFHPDLYTACFVCLCPRKLLGRYLFSNTVTHRMSDTVCCPNRGYF